MEFFGNLMIGFRTALTPSNLLFCFLGVSVGTLIGVLPGIGPVGAMAILLPLTYDVSPTTAIIMLAGIYYGAQYGGSTTSILVNIPGEASSVVTCLDGYQMARQGRAGPALGIAAFGSFIGGTLSIVGLQMFAPSLVSVALSFGPPEYFSLMILGLVILTYLSQKSLVKALMMAGVGIFLGTIGLDSITGRQRFAFNIPELFDGVGLVPLVMGLFGISEVFLNLEKIIQVRVLSGRITHLFPNLKDWIDSKWAILRGTILGFFLGILPGGGVVLASFVSYATEKRCSKTPEKFGHGAIEGVAGPETANNAAAGGAFVPLLSMGIPSNVIMAILLGALMIHGIAPGPMLLENHPDLFWGVITSMYVGNAMLLVLNLPLIGLWVRVLRVPYAILFPLILLFCLVGSYVLNNSIVDVILMLLFGTVGYLMRKFEYEPAPLVMAFVLCPLLEQALRHSLILSDGSFTIFLTRPISVGCLILAGILLITSIFPFMWKRRQRIIAEADDES